MPSTRPERVGKKKPPEVRAAEPAPEAPRHVALVAMGSSAAHFVQLAASEGGVREVCDEVWVVNAMAAVLQHDRVFVMQDIRHNITREASEGKKTALGILNWLPTHPGPVYTSTVYPEWPGLVEYPIRDVLQTIGGLPYLNNSVAYAVAFALHIGVKELSLYGCDFSYPDHAHVSESGRGCVEYILSIAALRGMKLNVPNTTTLLDANKPDNRRLYGYHDPTKVEIVDGKVHFARAPCT